MWCDALAYARTPVPTVDGRMVVDTCGSRAEVGRDAIILPDNDDSGRDHADQVRQMLTGFARSVRVLPLPNLPAKGDVSDWLANGGTRDALLSLVADAQVPDEAATQTPDKADDHTPNTEAVKISADNKTIARLVALTRFDYDRQRESEASKLGVRVTTLDAEVNAARGDGHVDHAPDTKAQGRALALPEPEPWPESVDGAELCEAVAEFIARYVALPNHAGTAMTLWAIHTHCFELWRYTPRLHFTAATRRAGKTRALSVEDLLVAKPLRAESITPPALFRTVEMAGPTLLLDEVNALLSAADYEKFVKEETGH